MSLVPPVQIVTRCPGCGYERSGLALHAKAVEEALRCERCKEQNEVLAHRQIGGPACTNCL
jgi:hypothetical protein